MRVPVTDIREAKREAALMVIHQIDRYGGEVIEKDRHPLWMAAVALERLSLRTDPSVRVAATKQQYRLDNGLHGPWMRVIWASRDDMPNVPIDHDGGQSFQFKGPANPQLAMEHAKRLRCSLVVKMEEW